MTDPAAAKPRPAPAPSRGRALHACLVLSLVLAGATRAAGQSTAAAPAVEHPNRRTKPPRTDGAQAPAGAVSKAEAAARLEEGRRKFFQQEQGFDHDTGPPNFSVGNVFPRDQYGFPIGVQLPPPRR